MFIPKKLTKMPYAQAKVLVDGFGNLILVSYRTQVATVVAGRLHIFGLYSATTRKHISAFVSEYCGIDYQQAKWLYEHNLDLDLNTGELLGD